MTKSHNNSSGKMRWSKILKETLSDFDQHFSENELSYLSLTSKSEITIRDRLAYALHRRFKDCFKISREWSSKRVDLAILDAKNQPVCLVEIKLICAFDIVNPTNDDYLVNLLKPDKEKLCKIKKSHSGNAVECFQLLLAVNTLFPPSDEHDQYIKYGRKWRGTPCIANSDCQNIVQEKLGEAILGDWPGGEFCDIPVSVQYWLFNHK